MWGGAAREAAKSERAVVVDGAGGGSSRRSSTCTRTSASRAHEYKEDIASGPCRRAAGGYARLRDAATRKPVNDTRAVTELMLAPRRRSRRAARCTRSPRSPWAAGRRELTGDGASLATRAPSPSATTAFASCRARVMRRALEYARTFDMPVIQHCEDHTLTDRRATCTRAPTATRLGLRGWPRVAEDVIVARDVLLAESTERHATTSRTSRRWARFASCAKRRAAVFAVTCEVTPHHLLADRTPRSSATTPRAR